MSKYYQHTQLYTDGSKTELGVGNALITPERNIIDTLHPDASVFTAELQAIYKALIYCQTSNDTNFIICSDSERSQLDEERNHYSGHDMATCKQYLFSSSPIVTYLNGVLLILQSERNSFILKWYQIYIDDLLNTWKDREVAEWQNNWDQEQTTLRTITPSIISWKSPKNLERREEVVIERLRLGHTNLTSIHLLRGEPAPMCLLCDEPLTNPPTFPGTNWSCFSNIESLRVLYFSYIRSKLEYAALIWSPIYENAVILIESVQRKCLKFMFFKTNGFYPQRGIDNNFLLVDHLLLTCPNFDAQRNRVNLKDTMADILDSNNTDQVLAYLKLTNLFYKI
ncbi:hypothetical protein NQ317_019429 [Molorchus minor]|uniref:RNase H type-1 domain-containing protein n=1 Tax=Molorchus minor TaxID=1323400 RepID=A0ABQ9IUU7_9CUCU|nr:hypothetical protein NQ317_019429 [Molorchus minor]